VAIACRAIASPKAGVGRNFSITPKDSDPAGDIYCYACGRHGRLYTWQSSAHLTTRTPNGPEHSRQAAATYRPAAYSPQKQRRAAFFLQRGANFSEVMGKGNIYENKIMRGEDSFPR